MRTRQKNIKSGISSMKLERNFNIEYQIFLTISKIKYCKNFTLAFSELYNKKIHNPIKPSS